MKPQLISPMKCARVIPNTWILFWKLASSYLFHRALASSSLLVCRAWYISLRSAGVRWMLLRRLRSSRSVITASFIVDAAG